MKLAIDTAFRLNNGEEMPCLGFGTYNLNRGRQAYEAVGEALRQGYRHLDTAKLYGNEVEVGRAVRESGIPRKDIFVTTKLWESDQGYESALVACDTSLRQLSLNYMDLYLIHWPGSQPRRRADTWRAFEKLYQDGKCRSVGVSNYSLEQLQEVLAQSRLVPAVNQVEFSPFNFKKDLMEFCQKKKIVVQAWSPLTRGARLNDKTLLKVAGAYGKTAAQVLLRWCLQHGVSPLPKSSRPERIKENAGLFDFEISPEHMGLLDGLGIE